MLLAEVKKLGKHSMIYGLGSLLNRLLDLYCCQYTLVILHQLIMEFYLC